MHLPSEFIRKFERLLENEAEIFFQSYKEKKLSGLRINPLKINLEEWNQVNPFSLIKIPFVKNGFYYDPEKDQPGKHPFHAAELYYIQEPSAMFVADQLAPKAVKKSLIYVPPREGKPPSLRE